MRRILLSLLLVFAFSVAHAEDYALGPDSQVQDGVPKGTVTNFTLAPGKDYPGTPHNCAVYTGGEVFFATSVGIQIAMQNGRIAEILNSPITGGGPLTAITFDQIGDQNWLYAAQDGKLFRRPVKVTGATAWTVVKPPKPTL